MTATATQNGTALAPSYKAERLEDGRILVRDVPLFSEQRPTDPRVQAGQGVPRDRAWLAAALETFRARHETTGYLPPMNLRHFFNGPERVGNFWPKALRQAAVNPGEPPRWTIFGDLIFGDDPKGANKRLSGAEAFELAKGYDHRSVEISPDAPNEIDCLALLRESAPAHKYTPLRVEAFESLRNDFFQVSASALEKRAIHANKEVGMADEDKKPAGDGKPADPMHEAPPWAKAIHAAVSEMCGTLKAHFESKKEGEEPDGDEKPAAEPSALPADDKLPAVMQGRAPAQPAGAETFASRLELHQLRSVVEKFTKEKEATAHADQAARKLADLGLPVSDEYRRELFAAALEGGSRAMDREIASAKRVLGMGGALAQDGGPRPFGTFGAQTRQDPEPLKKALEAFGSQPGAEPMIRELYAACESDPRMRRKLDDFARFVGNQPEFSGAKNGRG